MIKLHNVIKTYGSIVALDSVDLEVRSGSITGLLGPNGSGKSTLFRSILGLTPIDGGEIEIGGVRQPQGHSAERRLIVAIADSDDVYDDLSPREMAAMTWSFHSRLSGRREDLPAPRFDMLAEMLEMSTHMDRALRALSHGTRRKAQLLAAVLCGPAVLLIDEPTNGLDPDQHVVVQFLLRALADRGAAILMSTHNLAFAESVCDTVTLLRASVIASGSPQAIREQTQTANLADAYTAFGQIDRDRLASAARSVFE